MKDRWKGEEGDLVLLGFCCCLMNRGTRASVREARGSEGVVEAEKQNEDRIEP